MRQGLIPTKLTTYFKTEEVVGVAGATQPLEVPFITVGAVRSVAVLAC